MEGVNNSVVDRVGKPPHSNYHSEGLEEDQTKQQHQQFVLGCDRIFCLQLKDTGN